MPTEQRLRNACAGKRILLAEDEPINQEVARELLETVGLSVDIADDGAEAVAMASQTRYDLILMDLRMPNMNGLEATKAIRALPGYEHLPFYPGKRYEDWVLEDPAGQDDRQQCLDAGMNEHIGKPVRPTELYETLFKWLSTSKPAAI